MPLWALQGEVKGKDRAGEGRGVGESRAMDVTWWYGMFLRVEPFVISKVPSECDIKRLVK